MIDRVNEPGARGAGKPTLVFVHGWCGNKNLWRAQLDHFARTHRVHALDLGGHGARSPDRDDWSIQRFGQDVIADLATRGIDNAVLVGHSMGGAVCAEAAIAAPANVRAVVLGDTFVFDYGHMAADTRSGILAGFRADLPAAIRKLVIDTTPAGTPGTLRANIVAQMARTPASVALPAFASLLAWDPVQRWPHLRCPVLAINGELIHPDARARYGDTIREYHMPGAGHFLHLEDPAGFNQRLATLLHDAGFG